VQPEVGKHGDDHWRDALIVAKVLAKSFFPTIVATAHL
jgi:hypothetical protein